MMNDGKPGTITPNVNDAGRISMDAQSEYDLFGMILAGLLVKYERLGKLTTETSLTILREVEDNLRKALTDGVVDIEMGPVPADQQKALQ